MLVVGRLRVPHEMTDFELDSLRPQNRWNVGKLRVEEEIQIVSWRPSLESMAGHPAFATVLGIIYRCAIGDDARLPGAVTFDDVLEISGQVAARLEQDAIAFAAYSRAGVNWREAIYYVRDLRLATERAASVLSEYPNVVWATWHQDDPDWTHFLFVVKTFRAGKR